MKVLYVLEHFHPYIGGSEKLFKNLAESITKEGNEAIVITTRFKKNLNKVEYINNVKILRLKTFNRFLFTFFSIFSVIKYARKCDIIHTTSYNAAIPAFIAGLFAGKKTIITFHEVIGKLWFKLPFLGFPAKLLNYCYEKFILILPFNYFVAVSEFTKQNLLNSKIKESKIITIYNGIDYSNFNHKQYENNDLFTYTYFGRLGVTKGLDILLQAAAKFNKKNKDSLLKLIIPQKPKALYKKIIKLINKYQLNNQIEILHDLPESKLHDELLKSDCVVIPSLSEGFCFAAVEACALKIPIVSSDKGALPEVISGKFIKMDKYNIADLAFALDKAKNNQWKNKDLIRFEIDKQNESYFELYRSMVK